MFIAIAGFASAQSEATLAINDVDDSAFPEVKVVFSADRQGRPLSEIAVGNSRFEETGAPATFASIQRVTDARTPLALVLALDVSGSMDGETLAKAQSSAVTLV